ncbi:hypothetical protein BJX96DRAFT_128512 [Aspergillus floccosus]
MCRGEIVTTYQMRRALDGHGLSSSRGWRGRNSILISHERPVGRSRQILETATSKGGGSIILYCSLSLD